MRVRFFANLRNITGCAEAEIPYEETAGALARSLCEIYGNDLRQQFFPAPDGVYSGSSHGAKTGYNAPEAEKFGPEIMFLINGRHANHLGGCTAPLKPEDHVDIFPILGGG